MKKACIATYCEWSSYGSVMQAIGLKKALKKLNCDSFIIRDIPAPQSKRDFVLTISKNPLSTARNILNLFLRKHKRNLYEKSVRFINQNVDIKYYNDYETLKKNVPIADYYIAGSDQIWHPALCKPAFFLDFLEDGIKRLSYAASMGVTRVSQDKDELFASLLSKFDYISVREKEMLPVVGQYTDKSAKIHIDPTFLVSTEEWRSLKNPYSIERPYILVYAIYWDSSLNKELKKLHKKTGYDIVGLCPEGVSKLWANKKIYDADPGQFLYLIDNAKAVISSSFHGVAFSMIFNKKFAPIINPQSPSRIRTLLDTLQVSETRIADVTEFDLTEFDSVNAYIDNERKRSICYLKEILDYDEQLRGY